MMFLMLIPDLANDSDYPLSLVAGGSCIFSCSNVSTTLSESCENVIQESYVSVVTTLSGNLERNNVAATLILLIFIATRNIFGQTLFAVTFVPNKLSATFQQCFENVAC